MGDLERGIDVVFVTAHDQYAVRAFELNAIDYLLEPIESERLKRTVERLPLRPRETSPALPAGPLSDDDRLFLRVGERMSFIKAGNITRLTADGDHTVLHLVTGGLARVRRSLTEWEHRLPVPFERIHRSTIINLDRVVRIDEWSHGSFQIALTGRSEPVLMSRRYAARVTNRLS